MARTDEQSIWLKVFAQVADIVMIIVAFATSFKLRAEIRNVWFFSSALSLKDYYNVMIICIAIWWLFLDLQKAYVVSRRISLGVQIKQVLRAAIFGTIILLGVLYLLRIEALPRSAMVFFLINSVLLLSLNRIFFQLLREFLWQGGAVTKDILIVGSGEKALRFFRSIWNHAEWRVNLVGFIEFDRAMVGEEIVGARIIGTPEDLEMILRDHAIEEVVFAVPSRQLEQCTDMLYLCEQEGVSAVILSDFFSGLVAQVETGILYDQPVLMYRTTRYKEWHLFVKRLFDIVFSAAALLVIWPILLILALLITLQDGGPVLFRQKRVGRWGKRFLFPKFRSMVINAEAMKAELMAQNEMKGQAFKLHNDPRVTKLGRFMRKFSLDELPQLWCVLKGDMSVVGPRPQVEAEAHSFETWHRRKLSVKPGLTCLWQVSGRSSISSFDEWAKLDLAYIDNWSLWLDFKIIFKTIPAVISGRGAH
jgi:exopolysaccharide biosynthesis polyprenyl glycosylphosphotransferase